MTVPLKYKQIRTKVSQYSKKESFNVESAMNVSHDWNKIYGKRLKDFLNEHVNDSIFFNHKQASTCETFGKCYDSNS